MFRILYWNDNKELLSFNTLANSFREAITLFQQETNRSEHEIYSINVIN